MTTEEQLQKETELVKEFMIHFYKNLNYYPTVITRNNTMHNKDDLKIVKLDKLQTYFETFLPTQYGKKLKLGARNRTRYLVELRFIYFFIARSMGYNVVTIGRSIKMDHTSVLHGLNTFRNLYETSDPFRQKYIAIINYIKLNYEPSIVDYLDKVELES
jgi:chromosomal replication initiation ATPase DnaA